ncbi:MAG: hypothetical protein R3268_15200, partial [Acidiferrobacterales bacterium]|nr:hypothetical protein [Acidiferrobacterales bacterium]
MTNARANSVDDLIKANTPLSATTSNIAMWFKSGKPWIWLNAAAVSTSIVMVAGLVLLIAVRGLHHFWPKAVVEFDYRESDGRIVRIIGEIHDQETVPAAQVREVGIQLGPDVDTVTRYLVRTGNRDLTGQDFRWLMAPRIEVQHRPENLVVVERREWGNAYGKVSAVKQSGRIVTEGEKAWDVLPERTTRALALASDIYDLERHQIGAINYALERLRLRERRLQIEGGRDPLALAQIAEERAALNARYQALQDDLLALREQIGRDTLVLTTM